MDSPNILAILVGILVFSVSVSHQNDMCGMASPDPAKTCVSLRLPWSPQPMYFCTEKSKFRYRNQCQSRFQSLCSSNSMRQDTLMVAAPWDCCPLVSYPDSCASVMCPPPPLNRKCQTMEPNPSSRPMECCNTYFCEENMTPDTCHVKRLEPNCNMPPQEKKNCISFIDPFGCCPKFQCDGVGLGCTDARPGMCPAEMQAMQFMARFNNTNMMMMPGNGMMPMMMNPGSGMSGNAAISSPVGQAEMHMETKPAGAGGDAPPPPPPAAAAEAPAGRTFAQLISNMPGMNMNMNGQNQIQCVGDFNCPGTMKCCSNDMNVYIKDGMNLFRNRNPTYGYCMQATMMNGMTKTIKYQVAAGANNKQGQ